MSTLKNSVRLQGHLGADAEIKTTANGKKLAKFSLATNAHYTNAQGEKVKETQWHNLIVWGKQADFASKYLLKGKEIAVSGKLTNNQFTDKDGNKRYSTEVVVDEILLLGSKDK